MMMNVCVFTGSNSGARPEYVEIAREVGRSLAHRNINLVYGGARVGLMGALADASLAEGGHVIGVMPEALIAKEVAHRNLSELKVVKSMHERKALMADLSDGFIAMPGGFGTLDEFFEILTWVQLGFHRKPCGLLNACGYYDPLLKFIEHAVGEGFVRKEHAAMILTSGAPASLLDLMAAYEPPIVEKWVTRAQT